MSIIAFILNISYLYFGYYLLIIISKIVVHWCIFIFCRMQISSTHLY